jgi:3-phenylpropionate/trans-cinnamate dioxygenase ferredoxin reductase subunit
MTRLLVLGGGQAGAELALTARARGFAGEIVIAGDEAPLPYRRPPLSKEYLAGAAPIEQLWLRPASLYAEQRIELRRGARAVSIDRAARRVLFSDGGELGYSALALTLGARVRPLEVPGAGAEQVHYLRSVADVDRLRAALASARAVAIVGGGFVGLEAAAVLAAQGRSVAVIEQQGRLLPRAVSPAVSAFYQRIHAERGAQILVGAGVAEITRAGQGGVAVTCHDGRGVRADLVLVGIGVLPNQELAREAGLACEDGVVVDELARTSDPEVVAAGDCTFHPNPLLGRRLRLESVHNAVAQATTAAHTVCGEALPYAQLPWFWSDQYTFKLQMVGLCEGHDEQVVRGSLERGKFSVVSFRARRLIAVESVNSAPEHILVKRLLAAGRTPTPEQAGDPAFELKSLLG